MDGDVDVPMVPLAAKEHNKTQMYMGQHRCRMALRCETWVQYLLKTLRSRCKASSKLYRAESS